VLAFPPILTNSYVAVDQVDPDTVDAAKGIGLKPWQVVAKVELPLSLPLIFAGIRTSGVFVFATATLAGLFGGGGLGDILNNRESYGLQGIIAASYVLIVLAFIVQLLFIGLERAVTPAGLRVSRRSDRSTVGGRQAKVFLDETGQVDEPPPSAAPDEPDDAAYTPPQLEKGRTT
jgi:osmoprotectant transport system permease protein